MIEAVILAFVVAVLVLQIVQGHRHDRQDALMRAHALEMVNEVAGLRRVLYAMTIPPTFREPEDEP